MKTFEDLDFKPHTTGLGGVQALLFFENGFGVSVIKSNFSYGGNEGKYELASIVGDEEEWGLTGELEGHLTPSEVTNFMIKIQSLWNRHL